MTEQVSPELKAAPVKTGTVFTVLFAISSCHMLNDMMQSLLPAIYPTLRTSFALSFTQIGGLTLAYQLTASILQPVVGFYADRHPTPWALPTGPVFSLIGLVILSMAHAYPVLVAGACVLGLGSAIFHPESSRVARMASGGRHGFAQSLFQVGGNAGGALGPLAAALVVVRWGQSSLMTFALLALLACAILWWVSSWYKDHGVTRLKTAAKERPARALPRRSVILGVTVLMTLIFSKFFYLASLSSYYTLYLIDRFGVSVQTAQLYLFAFLTAVALGTLLGGSLGDKFGRKRVIWFSIAGVLPFSLILPHAGLFWTGPLSVVIGFILASAFPAIVVFAQELVPSRIGMISGLSFGFSFGMGGLGAAFMGWLADRTSIETVYQCAAFLPAIGFLAVFLPNIERK